MAVRFWQYWGETIWGVELHVGASTVRGQNKPEHRLQKGAVAGRSADRNGSNSSENGRSGEFRLFGRNGGEAVAENAEVHHHRRFGGAAEAKSTVRDIRYDQRGSSCGGKSTGHQEVFG